MSDPLGGLAPEEQAPPAEAPPPREHRRPFTPTTWGLLALLAVAFAAEGLVAHDPGVQDSVALVRLGALFLPAVRDGDWWRIGSYAFLHIGWVHIAMNAYALWILAPQLEGTFGSNATMGMFAATALLLAAALFVPPLRDLFHFGPVHLATMGGALGVGVAVLVGLELLKHLGLGSVMATERH